MEPNQLIKALGDAAAVSNAAQDYCIFWSDYWWWMCMTKAEWSGWMQAMGAVLALAIAIGVPWWDQRRQRNERLRKAAEDADITIRFHSELFETNESMLRVAIGHVPQGVQDMRPDAGREVLEAVGALRAIDFEHIKTVALHDAVLGQLLADFRCELQYLTGIIDRNRVGDEFDLVMHAKSVRSRLARLNTLSIHIRNRTLAQ